VVGTGVMSGVAVVPVGETDAEHETPAQPACQGGGARALENRQVPGIVADERHLHAAEGDQGARRGSAGVGQSESGAEGQERERDERAPRVVTVGAVEEPRVADRQTQLEVSGPRVHLGRELSALGLISLAKIEGRGAMLSKEENEIVSRVGPGTLMGNLFR